jgi:hypothetical protein
VRLGVGAGVAETDAVGDADSPTAVAVTVGEEVSAGVGVPDGDGLSVRYL